MRNILLDTDIGPDCDDAAAVALACIHARMGKCRILGIGHCTSNPYGAGAADVLCRAYGLEVPVGTYGGAGFLDGENCRLYNEYLATHYENRYTDTAPEEVVSMYRRILSRQKDGSVEMIAIGPLNNLSDLLDSGPDAVSCLTGRELVRKKVGKLTVMGGAFRQKDPAVNARAEKEFGKPIGQKEEFNIVSRVEAARNVAEHWPTPKDFVGFEAGLFLIGRRFSRELPEDHPLRVAYRLFSKTGERYVWDIITVDHALNPDSERYRLSEAGRISFDTAGRTCWTPDPKGTDHFVEVNQDENIIAEELDALLSSVPERSTIMNCKLTYTKPVTRWDEAIPLGCGQNGALIWGGPDHLRFSLDRTDIWDVSTPHNTDRPGFYLPAVDRTGPCG